MQRTVVIQVEVAINADTDEQARAKARDLAKVAHSEMLTVEDPHGRPVVKDTYYVGHRLRRY